MATAARTTPLTSAQREHAITRINQIADTAKATVKEKHTSKPVFLSQEQKIALIRSGKVKLKTNADLACYGVPVNLFNFSAHEKLAVLSPVGKTKIAAIDKQIMRTIDEVMLGDSSFALEAIQSFEKNLKV